MSIESNNGVICLCNTNRRLRILDGFRSLRWAPLQSKMLDYQNMQMLLIGAHADDNDLTGIEPHKNEEGKDGPLQELGRLEGEDEIRVSALKGTLTFLAVLLNASTRG
jgi:hypothetical protein